MQKRIRILTLFGFILLLTGKQASALSFFLKGELSLGFEQGWQYRSPFAPGLGFELSQSINNIISLGLNVEGNFFSYSYSGSSYSSTGLLLFYGGILRAGHLPQTRWFIDTQVGATPQARGTPYVPAIGIGIGYHMGNGTQTVTLCPRLGFRLVPLVTSSSAIGNPTQAIIDLGVLIWFNIFGRHSLLGWSGGGSSI